MLSAQQAAWGAKDPLREKFTKEEKKLWTKEEKKMYKCCYDLHGIEKATYTMRKLFAKRKAEADGVPLESEKKAAPKKELEPVPLINSSKAVTDRPSGQLLLGGTLDFDTVGSSKTAPADQRSLWSYHRSLTSVRVAYIATGPASCHTIAITDEGQAYAWGRNKHGQLGLGDARMRVHPEHLRLLANEKISVAATGRKHTLFATAAGDMFACGSNAEHQLGVAGNVTKAMTVGGSADKPQLEPCATKPSKVGGFGSAVTRVSCGAEFSAAVDSEGLLAMWGKPEFGQLGNGTTGEYIAKANKIDYSYVESPEIRALQSPAGCAQVADVACGNNHTLALMADGTVFTWGFGGYGRLGHRDGADQMTPKAIADIGPARWAKRQGVAATMIAAGSTCSFARCQNGVCYFWGTNKPSAEATMSPKAVSDLSGWQVSSISCGNSSTLVAADSSVITWGPSPTYGELGYGDPNVAPKSSTKPKLVDAIEGIKVHMVSVGFGHCALIAEDNENTRQLPVVEGADAEDTITGKKHARSD